MLISYYVKKGNSSFKNYFGFETIIANSKKWSFDLIMRIKNKILVRFVETAKAFNLKISVLISKISIQAFISKYNN